MTRHEENLELIKLFSPCRVTDVRDGMDWMGYHAYGSMDYSIRPLFRKHVVGIARTARYIPYEGPAITVTGDAYTQWSMDYYRDVCSVRHWVQETEPGDFIVIDVSGCDVGLLGSNNSLEAIRAGAVGFVLNGGGIRDTDEVIMEGVPVWCKHVSQGMDQCRLRYLDKNVPVAIGGVAVYPGDVIVADNDGVIVVPRKVAYDVGKYAWQEMNGDKVGRQKLYKDLGWEPDDTVIPVEEIRKENKS